MLVSLSIRHFVIVDGLELEFAPGFTVLTGETGAGKSILIDALLLALGERADADVVREGAARSDIAAEFRPTAAVACWLAERELAGDDAGLVLVRRTVDASGRSRSFINGAAVTLAQLRELGEQLVDVHGQHEHQSLLRPAAQLALLDEHGALGEAGAAVALAFADWRSERQARERAEAMAASALAEQERLRWIVDELGALAPASGEWAQVEQEHRRLSHAAGLLEGARVAVDSLGESDSAAASQVAAAATRLGQLAAYDSRLAPIIDLLQGAQVQLDEAVSALQKYVDRSDLDASRLADVEARVAALHGAARRFQVAPEALNDLLAESRDKLAALAAASDLAALRSREATAQTRYDEAARALGRLRAAAAKRMGTEVTRAMQDLSMAGGRFEVQLHAGEPSAHGNERAEFMVAAHGGVAVEAARPRGVGRRAGAHLARDCGHHVRRDASADVDLRRGRCRHRRRGRRNRRAVAEAARPESASAVRDAPAAGGGARRPALRGQQGCRCRTAAAVDTGAARTARTRRGAGANARRPGDHRDDAQARA